MDTQEFLTVFESALLVGGPKRQEILRELEQHAADEYTQALLRNPKTLAYRYNRVHIGLLASRTSLMLFWTGIMLTTWLFHLVAIIAVHNTPIIAEAFILFAGILVLGWHVARIHQPWKTIRWLLMTTFVMVNVVGLLPFAFSPYGLEDPDVLAHLVPFSASMATSFVLFGPLMNTMFFFLFLLLVILATSPLQPRPNHRHTTRAELIIVLFISVMTYLLGVFLFSGNWTLATFMEIALFGYFGWRIKKYGAILRNTPFT